MDLRGAPDVLRVLGAHLALLSPGDVEDCLATCLEPPIASFSDWRGLLFASLPRKDALARARAALARLLPLSLTCRDHRSLVWTVALSGAASALRCPVDVLQAMCRFGLAGPLSEALRFGGWTESTREPSPRGLVRGTPLHSAVLSRSAATVALALRTSLDPNAADGAGETALYKSCRLGDLDIASLLLASRADPDAGGRRTALNAACRLCDIGMVSALLFARADVRLCDADAGGRPRRSPVDATVTWPLELERGDVWCVGLDRLDEREAVLTLLLDAAACPDGARSEGRTALHLAVASDLTGRLARKLLSARAEVGAVDDAEGLSALHLAASRGHGLCVRLLVQARADPSARDLDGRSSADVALRDVRPGVHLRDVMATRAVLGV